MFFNRITASIIWLVTGFCASAQGPSRTLTSATDGNWNDPNCWIEKASGRHSVPRATDTVNIGPHTIIMTEQEHVAGFQLLGGTLDLGAFDLETGGEARWDDGIITGTGGFMNRGKLSLADRPTKTLQGTFNNFSTVEHVDSGNLHIDCGSRWVNREGSVYDLQSDAHITGLKRWDATPRFVNEGLFRKSGGSATSRIEVVFRNLGGTIEVDTGTLTLAGTGGSGSLCSNGTFQVAKGAVLDLGGGNVNVYNGTFAGDGEGVVEFRGGILRTCTDFEPTVFRFKQGGFVWSGGTITPVLNEFVNEGRMELESASVKNITAGPGVRNKGAVVNKGAGQLNIEYGGNWRNDPGSLYELQGDVGVSATGGKGAEPVFDNAGTFRKTRGAGIATINSRFMNEGNVEVSSGTLNFSDSFTQRGGVTRLLGGDLAAAAAVDIQAGDLRGSGRIFAAVHNAGTVAPGCSPGIMNVVGDFVQEEKGRMEIELGGRSPGTQYDQLLVRGNAALAGTLRAVLVNGFVPSPNDQFDIVQSATCHGLFSATELPALPDGLDWQVSYGSQGVRLTVIKQ